MTQAERADVTPCERPPCRFCGNPAVERYAMDQGCVCYPDDREQDLCAQHVVRATPRGSMELVRTYVEGGLRQAVALSLQPITFAEAAAFIARHHRHHKPPLSHRFSIAVNDGENVVGVITVGRPVARALDNGYTAEVTRCCTDGTPNAASKLYAAAWRCARAMGYRRLITYTLASESGTTLRATGWRLLYQTQGGSWDTPSRPRVDTHPTEPKLLWEAV